MSKTTPIGLKIFVFLFVLLLLFILGVVVWLGLFFLDVFFFGWNLFDFS